MPTPELSVVVPVFNEAGNILPLLDEVEAALNDVCTYEVIFIDDGSSDGSAEELLQAQARSPAVRLFKHVKRSGKSAGLVTGFWAAQAPWIQTLDGDRQNDPADVARIWKKIQPIPEGLGIVAGVRNRRNDGAIKWASSRIANFVRRNMLRDDTADTGCGFKLIRRDAALRLPFFDGMHRFLPALVRRQGYSIAQEKIEDRPRVAGLSKYGFFGRLGAGIFDLMGVFWLMRRGTQATARELPRP
ncbi:MAG TPA: glycosyltransferase family 2 protein [Rhizomicrobium sp.]|jgi:dolichol-phosphate mannosyltransferase|nr:glycosyltransferase family 2 protein [Acidisoma sp.]